MAKKKRQSDNSHLAITLGTYKRIGLIYFTDHLGPAFEGHMMFFFLIVHMEICVLPPDNLMHRFGGYKEFFSATVWTPNPRKTAFRIAAVEVFLNNLLDDRAIKARPFFEAKVEKY